MYNRASHFTENSNQFLTKKGQKRGALNPNSVLCTDQAPSPGFCALNPGSALNPRTLNPGTTVLRTFALVAGPVEPLEDRAGVAPSPARKEADADMLTDLDPRLFRDFDFLCFCFCAICAFSFFRSRRWFRRFNSLKIETSR